MGNSYRPSTLLREVIFIIIIVIDKSISLIRNNSIIIFDKNESIPISIHSTNLNLSDYTLQ
jgi:hypothetical protein